MPFETLKGTEDSPPSRQIQINYLLDTVRGAFERYGFRPFDTPLIEYFDTLTHKYDEDAEIRQEIFRLQDRGERDLGLRYDLTIPLCRYIAEQKQIKLPFRRYHIGKVYRDGPVKPGRLREFIQSDADVVGIKGQAIEAEMLAMFSETYARLGIAAIIEINNNKILRGVLKQQGFEEKDLDSLILSIDKLKKIGKDGVLKELCEKGYHADAAQPAIELLLPNDLDHLHARAQEEELQQGIEELQQLQDYLTTLEVPFRMNLSMARGLNYYTGNIWEAYEAHEKISSSIGAGGRYDKGIGNYIEDGREFPAVGVSFGIIAMLACLEQTNKEGVTDILVVPLEESLQHEAFQIARSLRQEGHNTELSYAYKLKKAFDYAEHLGIRNMAIIGHQDLQEGVYTLRDLTTKEEEKRPFKKD